MWEERINEGILTGACTEIFPELRSERGLVQEDAFTMSGNLDVGVFAVTRVLLANMKDVEERASFERLGRGERDHTVNQGERARGVEDSDVVKCAVRWVRL